MTRKLPLACESLSAQQVEAASRQGEDWRCVAVRALRLVIAARGPKTLEALVLAQRGQRIREARGVAGLTQEAAADAVRLDGRR
ncbi:MAG: hypothetical protein EOO70_03680, partial [Myxococcaceae bacterium]